jgi:quinol monooxygenase YgiN
MINRGLLVRMEARPGKEAEVERFLQAALPLVAEETGTPAWFGLRFGRRKYGIFDVFPDDAQRNTHLTGAVAKALMERAGELFDKAPRIQKLDVLADKLPIVSRGLPDTKGLLLRFKAKPGREAEAERFLYDSQQTVMREAKTTAWFAIKTDDGEYGIFDVFPDNGGRFRHLTGRVPRRLAMRGFKMLGSLPELEMLNVKAEKMQVDYLIH